MRRKYRNKTAVQLLKALDYELPRIRVALHKLTGISQPDMADMIGVSRQVITHHIAGRRHTTEVQEAIAKIWQVPKEELFDEHKRTTLT